MPEDLIVRHCAPTLAGLKTGNMFTATFADEAQLNDEVRKLNRILMKKGLRITVLRVACCAGCDKLCDKRRSEVCIRALIYIYRPGQLQNDLEAAEARDILLQYGYEGSGIEGCIQKLTDRICECDGFPHEVGLFLGYPPEDVRGFIEFGGRECKACGYWKVYGDVDHARKQFERFRKCTGVYLKCLERGLPISKLAVSKSTATKSKATA